MFDELPTTKLSLTDKLSHIDTVLLVPSLDLLPTIIRLLLFFVSLEICASLLLLGRSDISEKNLSLLLLILFPIIILPWTSYEMVSGGNLCSLFVFILESSFLKYFSGLIVPFNEKLPFNFNLSSLLFFCFLFFVSWFFVSWFFVFWFFVFWFFVFWFFVSLSFVFWFISVKFSIFSPNAVYK